MVGFLMALLMILLQGFSLLLPILISGISLIVCMRKGWLARLDVPLDGGLILGGQPLIGRSKSVRSLVLYLFIATFITWLLHVCAPLTDAIAPVYRENPFILGPATTLAYLAGEVLNSFVKRRLGISTSGSVTGPLARRTQAIVDNVDGMLASGLVLIIGYSVATEVLAASFVLAIVTHFSTDALMRRLGLKRKQR